MRLCWKNKPADVIAVRPTSMQYERPTHALSSLCAECSPYGYRAIARQSNRAIKRSSGRSSDRSSERTSDRATERSSDRAIERSSDRAIESSLVLSSPVAYCPIMSTPVESTITLAWSNGRDKMRQSHVRQWASALSNHLAIIFRVAAQ